MNRHHLFAQNDLSATLDNQRRRMVEGIDGIPAKRLLEADPEELVLSLYDEFKANPIELGEPEVGEPEDVKIDVRGDPNRAIIDDSRPVYVDGLRVRYFVPFTGDAPLLTCRPSTYSFHHPSVAKVGDQELIYEYDRTDHNVEETRKQFETDLGLLKQWVGWSTEQVITFNRTLPIDIRQRISERRDRLARGHKDAASLGFKVRPREKPLEGPAPSSRPSPTRRGKERKSREREVVHEYDVALSFAGEDREYVGQVAGLLQERGVRVFYDEFEKAKLWGADLAVHFAEVYGRSARFVVLFLSKHYASKAWPKYEKQHALARAIKEERVVLLPARFDDTDIPGIAETIGYVDLRTMSPDEFVQLVLRKIEEESD